MTYPIEIYQPRIFVRGRMFDQDPISPMRRVLGWLGNRKWSIAFVAWMLTGFPASILGGAVLGVKIAEALR